jgi:hypothetical protein
MNFEDDAATGKGVILEPFTIEVARRIVGEVLERRDMPRKKQTEEDEIDELVDSLDELDEEEDEVEDEIEDEEEEEEDPDEAPKRARKTRTKKSTAKKAKAEQDGVGTVEVAAEAGIEPRQLRMYLRAKGIQPGEDRDGRYHWASLESKEVKQILAAINKGAVDKLNKEKLDDLKGRSKKTTTKKTTRRKVRTQKK